MKLFTFSLPIFVACSLAAPTAEALQVGGVTVGGSGCPSGSQVTVNSVSLDSITVTVSTNSFVARGSGSIVDRRKFCQLNLALDHSSKIQYAVTSATFSGRLDLGSGASATQSGTYYFAGSPDQATTEQSFSGPANREYSVTKTISGAAWSPCGESVALNVKNALIVNGNSGTITGSIGGKAKFSLNLAWRAC